ncbi:sensor histidine kinase [Paenibacillus tritici]|uniref:histidine kinase n=1 Tax=Paenibacillus tritici TaxID=1873425 RepID=A0ABX2DTW9_9BACL|nr:sensor histidine kinase [Paenibacillus tritici]NQX48135.1 sensor histidine kinase [Paenibacillus tritici]
MRLFWKDQVPLLLFYLLQMLLVPVLYWISGEDRPPAIIGYGVLLSGSILLLYLGYRYVQHRRLYKLLSSPGTFSADQLTPLGEVALPEAVQELLQNMDRQYQEKLNGHIRQMDQHIVFINRWVHQMKTPISVIQLILQDLEDETAGSIQEEVEKLRKGLEMVIHTSRLERFENDFHVELLSLRKTVGNAVAGNRRLFIRRGVSVNILVDDGTHVYSDAKWLMFMLGQILTNAVNYTVGSGKTVTISAHPRGKDTVLEISDQGIGISPEDLKRVFNPYFTGERGRQYHESTGMGLYLVKEICTRLGHAVELESRPGAGTAVRIIFNGQAPVQ